MKVTLPINGREMTFSEQELVAIVENYFSSKTTNEATTAKIVWQRPAEDVWFEVKPQDIDQKLFAEERTDVKQEKTRQLILEAFAEMKKKPEKYGKNFKTMIPNRSLVTMYYGSTIEDFEEVAEALGDHNANWVEQALEWAQRIAHGEPWEDICNTKDTANWYRLVIWKNGYYRFVGGSKYYRGSFPASRVDGVDINKFRSIYCAVPLVVSYE